MTKWCDAREDFVGGFRPDERLGRRVTHGDEREDRRLQRAGTVMNSPLDLFLRQQGKPALNEVEPGGAGRSEVQMKAGMPGEPAMNEGRLVGAVVVQNQVHLELGGHRRGAKPCDSPPQVRKSLNSCSTNAGSPEPSA